MTSADNFVGGFHMFRHSTVVPSKSVFLGRKMSLQELLDTGTEITLLFFTFTMQSIILYSPGSLRIITLDPGLNCIAGCGGLTLIFVQLVVFALRTSNVVVDAFISVFVDTMDAWFVNPPTVGPLGYLKDTVFDTAHVWAPTHW